MKPPIAFIKLLLRYDLGIFVAYITSTLVCCASENRAETTAAKGDDGVERCVLLPPSEENPRNSEGDFVRLSDGRILFAYTHFTGGRGDHSTAHIAGRYSEDNGKTWTAKDEILVENEGDMNIMSISLLRLAPKTLALFYIQKNSLQDCRPVMRLSHDEGFSWGPAIQIVPDQDVGYYVLNNDRVIQLESGRLIVPLSNHSNYKENKWDGRGTMVCYLSDDNGRTWRRGKGEIDRDSEGFSKVSRQEPGVIELNDGRIMMFMRTNGGYHAIAYSSDQGDTWTDLQATDLVSTVSPASIERIPSTGDLILVWNDHSNIGPEYNGKRTPFHASISQDEGKTWKRCLTLEDDPHGWYCYTAIEFSDGYVLLGHSAGQRVAGKLSGLETTQITRFRVEDLYRE